ncbi:MAG: hypothetical protein F6J89_17650 [Symploca sp. SIO1C4]|uniref:Uncharacterized protein n=1 Tax=Symploca sp. SIO1C4 TaxID=2607765 RepID=A0A6B3NHA0_9CYAN|nr:hypothetical protein [Symploca sp. SIO1C4]
MVYGLEVNFQVFLHTTRQILKTLHFSISGVDALQGEEFSYLFAPIWGKRSYNRVEVLLDELPTDWVKSD